MRKRKLFTFGLFMAGLGLTAGFLLSQVSMTSLAWANPPQERLSAQSLSLVSDGRIIADLGPVPGGATKLILRDRRGMLGLMLTVSDNPNEPRAAIQFFDSNGNLVRTLSEVTLRGLVGQTGSHTSATLPRVRHRARKSGKADGFVTGKQLNSVIDWLSDVERRLDGVVAMHN